MVRVAVTVTVAPAPTGTVAVGPFVLPPAHDHATSPAPAGLSSTVAWVAVWPVTTIRRPVLVVVRDSTSPPGGCVAGSAAGGALVTRKTLVSSWLPTSVTLTVSSIVPVAGSRIVRRSRVVGSAPSTFTS